MTYFAKLDSPLGPLTISSDGKALTGLWIEGQKYYAAGLEPEAEERPDLPVFRQTADWLCAYFQRAPLPPLPPLMSRGSAFRQAVWALLLEIPYGKTTTYGALTDTLKAAGVSAAPQAVVPPPPPPAPEAPSAAAESLLDALTAKEAEAAPAQDLSATRRVNINELKFGPNYRGDAD